ncbi:hypothetical protein FOA52_008813 [Chlamydomonas sp. UWO 241]|nr:hypothetical protein FOA52_008813 [Chlamydomonas sp. UWO 241]
MATSCIDVGEYWTRDDAGASARDQVCGLFYQSSTEEKQRAIALRSRSIQATVFAEHGFAEVTESLTYLCDEDCTAKFVFPLPPKSAVYRFKATIGDREVVTEVKRKAKAQQEYDDAVSQGHSAVHMKQMPGTGLFCVEVGNLSAMEEAVVTFSYVRILNAVAGAVEFEHQASWVPPYVPPTETDPATGALLPAVADANPTFAPAHATGYSLSYTVVVRSSRGFASLDSPCDGLVVEQELPTERVARWAESVSDASRDFSLLIELPKLGGGAADGGSTGSLLLQEVVRNGQAKTVALATFVPRFAPPPPSDATSPKQQIIFVVDGSGSMGGSPIQQALEAALFFVKDLPAGAASGIEFNAAVFGSSFTLMWPQCKGYDEATQRDAVAWLQANVNADWGGTEIHKVLAHIYEKVPLPAGATRQVVFLTDGGVSHGEEKSIADLVQGRAGSSAAKAAAANTTIFSLGIGHGVHRGLVDGVATKTCGLAQFVVDGEPIGHKAGVLKRAALAGPAGCLSSPRLAFRGCLARNVSPNMLPPRVFPSEPLHVLLELPKAESGASLQLIGRLAGMPDVTVDLPMDGATRVDGDALAVLHAMASIGCLLSGTSSLHVGTDGVTKSTPPEASVVEDAIVELGVAEGLVTPHTSAVGVLLQRDPLDPSAVTKVHVPLALPAGRSLFGTSAAAEDMRQRSCRPMCLSAAPMLFGSGGGGGGAGSQAPGGYASMQPQMAMCSAAAPQRKSRGSGGGALLGVIGGMFGRAAASLGGSSASSACPPPPPPAPACAPSGAPTIALDVPMPSPAKKMERRREAPVDCDLRAADVVNKAAVGNERQGTVFAECCDDDECEEQEAACDDVSSPAEMQKESVAAVSEPASTQRLMSKKAKGGAASRDECEEKPEAVQRQQQQQQQASAKVLSPHEALSVFNLMRSVEGAVVMSPEVMAALAGQAYQQQQSAGDISLLEFAAVLKASPARPAALSDDDNEDAWATLLALAFLRKHLGGVERGTWEGLEAKALEWLAGVWARAGVPKSIGSLVLAAMKLV